MSGNPKTPSRSVKPTRVIVRPVYYLESGVPSWATFYRLKRAGHIKMFFIGSRLAQYQDEADRQLAAIFATNPTGRKPEAA
jgi:hypothetical protein